MVTKMVAKIGNLLFWSKFETFGGPIIIEHKQIQKDIETDNEDYHGTQHNNCWHFNIYEQDKFRAQLS